MAFNKGYELKKFEAHWEKLRIEYAAAGMAEDAIQKMYDYDRQQFNSERTRIERTQEFTAPAYESTEEEASPLMLRYQEAITTTDTYHETKHSFAWIGEIEDENLLAALEQLSDSDLELITLYAYEEYRQDGSPDFLPLERYPKRAAYHQPLCEGNCGAQEPSASPSSRTRQGRKRLARLKN